jgi:hypothetical protein
MYRGNRAPDDAQELCHGAWKLFHLQRSLTPLPYLSTWAQVRGRIVVGRETRHPRIAKHARRTDACATPEFQ